MRNSKAKNFKWVRPLWNLALLSILGVQQVMANPIVIAHRGASGYLPEHTLEAAALAYAMGADYIEQDLVLSKDRQLIVVHDIHLETVTDVESRFPTRAREDGRFYVIDFTLAELKTLRVHERTGSDGKMVFPGRYQGEGEFKLSTFAEQIEMIANLNRQLGKDVGLYPEIKAPAWHREQGYDISQLTLDVLRAHGLDDPHKSVIVQCFDFIETQRIRNKLGLKAKLVQLIADNSWGESSTDYDWLQTQEGLKSVAKVADGIGPWIPQLVDLTTAKPTTLLQQAHAVGLVVHPHTFRKERLNGATEEEFLDMLFKRVGIDGIFTDFTDTVVDYLGLDTEAGNL